METKTATAATVATIHKPKSRLASVVKGKIEKPIRIVLYGTDGVGKSSFAARSPSPIFIGSEDGTAQLDVSRMPSIASWKDILDSVDELGAEEHQHKTAVLDTADWAEPMAWKAVCDRGGKTDIEAFGYGKGYAAALDEWRLLLSKFERARSQRSMSIIVLAHSWVKSFKNPDEGADDFDRYELALHPKAGGLLKQWADCVLFANYETFTHEVKGRVKGVSTGARIMHTQRRAAFDAKNRYDLPETLPLDWDAFAEAVAAHKPEDAAVLKVRIQSMLSGITDQAVRSKVEAALASAGDDAAELSRVANKLSATVQGVTK